MAKKQEAAPGERAAAANPLVTQLDLAWARGDFSTVRALARQAAVQGGVAQQRAEALMALVKTDPVALLTGAASLAIVLIVALTTLHG